MGGLIGRPLGRLSGRLFGRLCGTRFGQPRCCHSGDANSTLGCVCVYVSVCVNCPLLRVAEPAQFCLNCSYCKLAVKPALCDLHFKHNDIVGILRGVNIALIWCMVPCPCAKLEYSHTFAPAELRLQFTSETNKQFRHDCERLAIDRNEMWLSHVNLQHRG